MPLPNGWEYEGHAPNEARCDCEAAFCHNDADCIREAFFRIRCHGMAVNLCAHCHRAWLDHEKTETARVESWSPTLRAYRILEAAQCPESCPAAFDESCKYHRPKKSPEAHAYESPSSFGPCVRCGEPRGSLAHDPRKRTANPIFTAEELQARAYPGPVITDEENPNPTHVFSPIANRRNECIICRKPRLSPAHKPRR